MLALNCYIAQCAGKPFNYGAFDCTQFAIACEKAIHGNTLFPELDRAYTTERQGLSIMAGLGFRYVWSLVDSRLKEVCIADAKRGDLVGHITGGQSFGIYASKAGFYCASESGGVMLLPLCDAVKVWRRV
jgi:hypothetical protein